jgi:hypothetical protein
MEQGMIHPEAAPSAGTVVVEDGSGLGLQYASGQAVAAMPAVADDWLTAAVESTETMAVQMN